MVKVRWANRERQAGYERYSERLDEWVPIERSEIAKLLEQKFVIHYNP